MNGMAVNATSFNGLPPLVILFYRIYHLVME
jgi:hypothetical protein